MIGSCTDLALKGFGNGFYEQARINTASYAKAKDAKESLLMKFEVKTTLPSLIEWVHNPLLMTANET